MTGKKREKPLGLDMDFGKALKQFVGVDPKELPNNARLGKNEGRQARSLPPNQSQKMMRINRLALVTILRPIRTGGTASVRIRARYVRSGCGSMG